MRLTIPGVPISVNHSYANQKHRRGMRVLTSAAEQYRDTVGWAAKAAWLEAGQPELAGSVVLQFYYYLPDRRRLDLDNTKKLICDGIAKALGLFRLRLNGAMSQFSIYGLDIFLAEALKTIEEAALELHERLNGERE